MMEKLVELLNRLADWVVYGLLDWNAGLWYADALHYFIAGFLQLMILLIIVSYLMGVVTSYLPFEKIRVFLIRHKKSGLGNIMASVFGAITPFCSCSSIPIFIGLVQARVPLGVAFSFLITSPLVNEFAIALFLTAFGWKVTLIYILTGVALGILGGVVLDIFKLERYVAEWVQKLEAKNLQDIPQDERSLKKRWPEISKYALTTVKNLTLYVAIGIGIGSFIHGYVPEEFFQKYLSEDNLFSIPLAVIVAVPLYIDAIGILPVIETLIAKGVPLGTAVAFMMGAIGLSLPEALLLKKVMQIPLLVIYFGTTAVCMILAGYFFNVIF